MDLTVAHSATVRCERLQSRPVDGKGAAESLSVSCVVAHCGFEFSDSEGHMDAFRIDDARASLEAAVSSLSAVGLKVNFFFVCITLEPRVE